MTETVTDKLKVKVDWITPEFSFRAKCPKCGRVEVFQYNRAREAYQSNVCEKWLKDSDIEPSRTERLKSFLTRKKELPEALLTIDTLIESSRTHSPDIIGNGSLSTGSGSLGQGTIATRNTLANILMNFRRDRTPEEIQFCVNHLEEIRDNESIRSYVDRQNPWVGYSWQKLIELIERYKARQEADLSTSKLTQARAALLEKYTPQNIRAGESSKLNHSLTQKIASKTGAGDLQIIPPKERAGDALGGTTELFKTEMEEHSKFSKQHEERLTEYYQDLGINDLTLDCPHTASRLADRTKAVLTGLRPEFVCLICGKATPREKILAQVKP